MGAALYTEVGAPGCRNRPRSRSCGLTPRPLVLLSSGSSDLDPRYRPYRTVNAVARIASRQPAEHPLQLTPAWFLWSLRLVPVLSAQYSVLSAVRFQTPVGRSVFAQQVGRYASFATDVPRARMHHQCTNVMCYAISTGSRSRLGVPSRRRRDPTPSVDVGRSRPVSREDSRLALQDLI